MLTWIWTASPASTKNDPFVDAQLLTELLYVGNYSRQPESNTSLQLGSTNLDPMSCSPPARLY